MKEATVTCQIVRVEPVSGAPYALADLSISCGICGQQRFVVHTHHVRAVAELLQDVMAAFPEETAGGEMSRAVPIGPGGGGVQ